MFSSKEDFLQNARRVYGGKYDYSAVKEADFSEKITIICPKHGPFQISPFNFIYNKRGCPQCLEKRGRNRKFLSTESFLELARKTWGDRWDYSKTTYSTSHEPITVICREHGEFQQDPYNHVNGHMGCRGCDLRRNPAARQELFITKARIRHGDKYDYSKVEYVSTMIPVTVICPEHGEFTVIPNQHLNKNKGCPACFPPNPGRKKKIPPQISTYGMTVSELNFVIQAVREHAKQSGSQP